VGGEFPITAISGDSGPPIFPLEIDEHDQLINLGGNLLADSEIFDEVIA